MLPPCCSNLIRRLNLVLSLLFAEGGQARRRGVVVHGGSAIRDDRVVEIHMLNRDLFTCAASHVTHGPSCMHLMF